MKASKWIAAILALLLVTGMIPVGVLAESEAQVGDDGKFHYVSIGDSTTNGFGFDSYYLNGTDVRGFNQVVPEAYPARIAQMLEDEGKDVVLHQFAGSALRPDDLDAILDPNHVDDDYTSRVFTGHDRGKNTAGTKWFEKWGRLIDPSVQNCADGEEVLRAAFYSAIQEADLITYYLGSNCFGTFLTAALTDNRYGDTDDLQDVLAGLGISESEINVAETRAKFMGMLAEQLEGQVDLAALDAQYGFLVDLLVQGYVGGVVYFTKNIEAIRQLNPDCEIVVVGLHNYVNFIKADYDGQIIDIGGYYGKILELFNIYMGSLCERADDYYYADLAEAEITVFINELIDGCPSETMQGYLDEMVGGMVQGVMPALAAYPAQTLGSMLRGLYEDRLTDTDYELIAQLASGMGLIDQTTAAALSALGLSVPAAMKLGVLYHTENDAFIPALDNLLAAFAQARPDQATTLSMIRNMLKWGTSYVSFQMFKGFLTMTDMVGLTSAIGVDVLLGALDEIGAQFDTFKNYGRVQEILLDCVSAEPFNLNEVMGALADGISMDAIGAEVAAVLMGQQAELSASTKTLINLYFMFMFPNGMGISAHPNEAGHEVMADVIYNAYKRQIVAKDYMDVKVLAIAENLIDSIIEDKGDVTVDSFSRIQVEIGDVTSYTSFGDSTVFGFGLEDFEVGSDIFNETYGYNTCSRYAYPALLADLLNVENADFHQLAMGSLRVEDILSILNGDTTGDEYYVNSMLPLLTKYAGGIEKAHDDYVEGVQRADLITIAMGGNNFGQFLNMQLDRVSRGEELMALDWSKYSDNELTAINAAISELFGMLLRFNSSSQTATLKVLAENFIYEYVSVLENYAPILDIIHELNPDAKIVFLGLFNPVDEVYYQRNGTTSILRLGKIIDLLMANINTSFCDYAQRHSDYCCYVNVEDTQMFADTDETADFNLAHETYIPYISANHGLANHPTIPGHRYMYRQILQAIGLTEETSDEPEVDNRTKENKDGFDAAVTFEDASMTAVVKCDRACVVLAEMEDGSYIRLTPEERDETTYTFDLSGIAGNYVLTVALKGDYNLDGNVTTNDVAQANRALVTETKPGMLQNFVFDMTGDNAITTNDVAKVNRSIVSEIAIAW